MALPAAADSSYQFTDKYESGQSGGGEFPHPYHIELGPAGTIYVVTSERDYVTVIDSDGTLVSQWGESGPGPGQLSQPRGVALDTLGNTYVADTGNDRVQVFDAAQIVLLQIGTGADGSGDGELSDPFAVAVAPASGDIYVADTANNRIQRFATDGNYIGQWNVDGSGTGALSQPRDVEVDAGGDVYVADQNGVHRYGADGSPLAGWTGQCSIYDQDGQPNGQQCDGMFNGPSGIALDADGNVYVADTGNDRVQKLAPDGSLIEKWGSKGSEDGQLNGPTDVEVGQSNDVYVADEGNDRIQKFSDVEPPPPPPPPPPKKEPPVDDGGKKPEPPPSTPVAPTQPAINQAAKISNLRITNREILTGRRGLLRRCSSKHLRVCPIATTATFRLSEKAKVRYIFERRVNRRKKLFRRVGAFSGMGERGANSFHFNSKIRGRWLKPGRYRLKVVARDSRGSVSDYRRVGFRVF